MVHLVCHRTYRIVRKYELEVAGHRVVTSCILDDRDYEYEIVLALFCEETFLKVCGLGTVHKGVCSWRSQDPIIDSVVFGFSECLSPGIIASADDGIDHSRVARGQVRHVWDIL
ncbi:MAG: hypothetical protein C5S46_05310 [Candidatus Methanomarinus sp.]|uniref:Uncharacterized protein n=1 Tax=Candidatus Methanomarinus sp. TaxID=3386244 RepID=A0AC61SAE4_9EURY|nr:MAG: hypothetical protein C5S46_05310 [ANME-2 cluster archaeon]